LVNYEKDSLKFLIVQWRGAINAGP